LSRTSGKADVPPWASITTFGDDAVTVATESLIVAPDDRIAELADKTHSAHGKRVVSTEGEIVGEIEDLEFDAATGALTALVFKDGAVVAEHLIAVGSSAAKVQAQTSTVWAI
jgi:sporulation protein YlmC with PRC-barrel domain